MAAAITIDTKVCRKCGIDKPLTEFYTHHKWGHQYWCKECAKRAAQQNRLANLDERRETSRRWYRENRERAYATKKEWTARNPDKLWAYNIKGTYGLSASDFYVLLKSQGGGCAVCGTKEPGGKGRFHVDHDHATGQVRGLLCARCNSALIDNEDVLLAMVAYLRRYQ